MEITGRIIQILELTSGEGKNGTWKKQSFILETEGQYPKKVCITLFGEKIEKNPITAGETITASIEVESREFNGRWYTDIKAWRIAKGSGTEFTDPFREDHSQILQNPAEGIDDQADDGLPF